VTNGAVPTLLPDPDFTCTPADCSFVAGIRPVRATTFRLEPESVGSKFVVHNYGHGGAGITMSWGCAVEVRDIVSQQGGATPGPVAVLGGGVMGLTAATLLVESGLTVAIYASSLWSTTSDVAGGQWQPSFVNHDTSVPGTQRFENILRTSFTMHSSRIGQGYGVSKRINYSKHGSGTSFDKVPRDVIPAPTPYAQLPFAHLNQPGFGYQTLLVEPPIFLKKLRDDLGAAGIPFIRQDFHSPADIDQLAEPIVVNCTGLGSAEIFNDTLFTPVKGQLVLLKPQPDLQYLYSSDSTYVFPRADHVVVGGSWETGITDATPDPDVCQGILRMAKNLFAGTAMPAAAQPWVLPEYGDRFR
jgi:D-amino-acid oxidase